MAVQHAQQTWTGHCLFDKTCACTPPPNFSSLQILLLLLSAPAVVPVYLLARITCTTTSTLSGVLRACLRTRTMQPTCSCRRPPPTRRGVMWTWT